MSQKSLKVRPSAGRIGRVIKWVVLLAAALEAGSFLSISAYNLVMGGKLRNLIQPVGFSSPDLLEHSEAVLARYEHIINLARAYGAEFILIWQPWMWIEDENKILREVRDLEQDYPARKPYGRRLKKSYRVINRAIRKKLEDRNYFYDLSGILYPRSQAVYKADGVHLNDYGRAMVARAIVPILVPLLPPPDATDPHLQPLLQPVTGEPE